MVLTYAEYEAMQFTLWRRSNIRRREAEPHRQAAQRGTCAEVYVEHTDSPSELPSDSACVLGTSSDSGPGLFTGRGKCRS